MITIVFKGFDETFVRVYRDKDLIQETHAVETPYPAFLLKNGGENGGEMLVQPFYNLDNKTWSFAPGLAKPGDGLPLWDIEIDDSIYDDTVELMITCPDDTEVIWYGPEA